MLVQSYCFGYFTFSSLRHQRLTPQHEWISYRLGTGLSVTGKSTLSTQLKYSNHHNCGNLNVFQYLFTYRNHWSNPVNFTFNICQCLTTSGNLNQRHGPSRDCAVLEWSPGHLPATRAGVDPCTIHSLGQRCLEAQHDPLWHSKWGCNWLQRLHGLSFFNIFYSFFATDQLARCRLIQRTYKIVRVLFYNVSPPTEIA